MSPNKSSFFAELKRRNVLRAAVLYVGAVWALSQGISQLSGPLGLANWVTVWFLIACAIGFPFWVAFTWFYEFTPHGFKRDAEVAADAPLRLSNGRRLDFAIIGVMAIAIVLLASGYFIRRGGPGVNIPAESVAVLPFTNESTSSGQRYFSDGLSEDLINALSQFRGLKVISRDSAFQFRNSKDSSAEIGRRLGVAHLLEGSVQTLGGEVRISATLVNAANGTVAWSAQYEKPYTDLFALQNAITAAVSSALQARLLFGHAASQSEHPPSGNLEAWQAYQQGRFYDARVTQAGFHAALAYYATAIRLDPRYAAAYARASSDWSRLAGRYLAGAAQQEAYTKARAAAGRALALAPDLALAHVARGYLMLLADFDWTGAQAEYQRAAQLAPNESRVLLSLGSVDATLGRVQQAVDLTRKALATDPLSTLGDVLLSNYLAGLGQLDAAQQAIAKAIELQPAADYFYKQLAVIAVLRGNARAALMAAQREPDPHWRREALALATQIGPDRKAADAALQVLIAKNSESSPYEIAEVYALRGDPNATFAWLNRALVTRDPGISTLLFDPFVLRYRADPRFAAFCRKAGLPTTSTDAVGMK